MLAVGSTVELWVPGRPITQGSKDVIPLKNGRFAVRESGGDRHKLWRHAVNDEVRRHWEGPPVAGPVGLVLTFHVAQPQKLTKARLAEGPIGARSGDVDKLARSVLDALDGVVYLDDAQVRFLVVNKVWAAPEIGPGVAVIIKGD